jgi:hypothetical protein
VLPFSPGGCGGSFNSFDAWQKKGFDVGSTEQALDPNPHSDTVQKLLQMAAERLLLPTGDVRDFLSSP